ncbi:MAG TPA: hypothetical protein VF733_05605 [Candidatus Saccharimonadales bacterium]
MATIHQEKPPIDLQVGQDTQHLGLYPGHDVMQLHEVPKFRAFPRIEGSLDLPGQGSVELPAKSEARTALGGVREWFVRKAGLKPPESIMPQKGTTLAERHPDWPQIKVSFLFSPHGSAVDMKDLPAFTADADIYLYENFDGERYRKGASQTTKSLQEWSTGDPDSTEQAIEDIKVNDRPVRGSKYEPQLRAVYGRNIAVGSIDLSKQENDQIGISKHIAEAYPIKEGFDETVDLLANRLRKQGQMQNEREAIMVGRFENEIARILKQFPELHQKSELKVAFSMGAYHTLLRHGLEEIGVNTDRQFSRQSQPNTYVYDYYNQLTRSYAYGREPSRNEKERAYAELMLSFTLNGGLDLKFQHHDALSEYKRKIVSQLTHEEIVELHDVGKIKFDSKALVPKFDAILQRKGMAPLVRSEREMIDLLMADRARAEASRAKVLADAKT